jgi:phage I-like protein
VKRLIGFATRSVSLDGEALPTEFLLFPFGPSPSSKGTALFDQKAAEAVMARYQTHGVDLMIDLEHDALEDGPRGTRADARDARGWFQLELRADGLWMSNIRWTPDGARRLQEKTQRYFSPAFTYESVDEVTDRITGLVNVALCARPATFDAQPLVAASDGNTTPTNPQTYAAENSNMDPKLVQQALDALVAGDEAKALELLKQLIASAAGAEPSAADNGAPPDPAAETGDAPPPPAQMSEDVSAFVRRLTGAATAAEGEAQLSAAISNVRTLSADREALELNSRRELIADLVKLGAETPATAWDGDASKRQPCKRLSAEPIDAMRERVKALRAANLGRRNPEPPPTGNGETPVLTPAVRAEIKKRGMTEEEFLAKRQTVARRA